MYWEALDSAGRHQEGIEGHWEALGAHCEVVDGTGKGIEGLQAAPRDTGGVLGGLQPALEGTGGLVSGSIKPRVVLDVCSEALECTGGHWEAIRGGL